MAGQRVTVIGLGKVGFPLACHLANLGHTVIGYDRSREVVSHLSNSKDPMPWEPGVDPTSLELITSNLNEAVVSSYASFITVPTPLDRSGYLSCEIVQSVLRDLSRLEPSQLRVVVSTLDPRTARQVCSNRLTVYCPPLVRLGSVMQDLTNPPLIMLGGTDTLITSRVMDLLKDSRERVPFSVIHTDPTTVALAKLAINVTLSSKAAWANEVSELALSLGANASVVAGILGYDPRIGPAFMQPGWPPSGPCLPRDLIAWCSLYRKRTLPHSLAFAVRANHARTKEIALGDIISQIHDLAKGGVVSVGVIGLNYRYGVPSSEATLGQELIDIGRSRGWQIKGGDFTENTQALVDACNIVVVIDQDALDTLDFQGKEVIVVRPKNS